MSVEDKLRSIFKNSSKYYILNKDTPVVEFTWDYDEYGWDNITDIKQLIDVPAFIITDIYGWLESRTPPKHREFVSNLLSSLNLKSTKAIIDYSKGLSLIDTLWVTNDLSLKWEDVNLYDNEFDETISKIAFDGGLYGLKFSTTSPEFSTDGMLAKCWVRQEDGIYLKKAGTSGYANAGNEPYSELIASHLLDVLQYNHVKYTVENFRGKVVSSCRLMTSKDVSMAPVHRFTKDTRMKTIQQFAIDNGFADDLYRMFIFDYLSLNTDRHAGNIGVLYDSETYDIISLAPLYDHGASMLSYYMPDKDNLYEYINSRQPALYDDFYKAAKIGLDKLKSKANLSRLVDFKLTYEEFNCVGESRIDAINSMIKHQLKLLLD